LFKNQLVALGLAVFLAAPAVAPASATSLAFEFSGPGFGFSIQSGPRGGARWGWGSRGLAPRASVSPGDVENSLRAKGFSKVQNLRRRGAIYQAQAIDPDGHRVGLVVNAQNGAILNVYRMR
jgi:hypothetical protein